MPGPHYSLRRLLAAVAASAIACAFLATAADLRVRALSGMTLAILAVATAAALASRGWSRVFAAGFAAAGWAYFAASNFDTVTRGWIAAAYDRFYDPPAAPAPEEVADFVNELVSFLMVGQLVVTMLMATLGGLLALAAWSLARRAASAPAGASTTSP